MVQQPSVGQGLLIIFTLDTSHSVGLLLSSDQPDTQISTLTTLQHSKKKDIHVPDVIRTQQVSGRRPTPQTALPLESALKKDNKKY